MPLNEWSVSRAGMATDARLKVDGLTIDRSPEWASDGREPIVAGAFTGEDGEPHSAAGFVRSGLLRVRLKVHVDGARTFGGAF